MGKGAISFPDLGITIDPGYRFLLFGRYFYLYGVIIAFGFLLALWYCSKRSKQFGFTSDDLIDMLIFAVPTAVIFARAYYVLFTWSDYKDNLVSVLYIWNGGLAIYGGIIGGILAVALVAKFKHIKLSAVLDLCGLGLLIGQAVGRWGNFINREAYGSEYGGFLKMGIYVGGELKYVHPTFLYESLWNVAGLVLLHIFSKRRKYDGQLFIMYIGWYGLGRAFIEGLRIDSLMINDHLRVSQFVAIASVIACVILLFYNAVFKIHEPREMAVYRMQHPEEFADEAKSAKKSRSKPLSVSPTDENAVDLPDDGVAEAPDLQDNEIIDETGEEIETDANIEEEADER